MDKKDEPKETTQKIILLNSILPKTTKTVEKTAKIPHKRVITTTSQWKVTDPVELTTAYQLSAIRDIISAETAQDPPLSSPPLTHKFIRQQIHQKLYGYKSQDLVKNKFQKSEFVDVETVLHKMLECENLCFYCKHPVQVLYEYVREPTQWTLERLDNERGHTCDNVVIACLHCNLRRRTMYHERYLFTKELSIKKV
jgi:hypothetical protein